MLPGLIYNVELAGILMLENVNMLRYFEALFTFLGIKMFANACLMNLTNWH